MVALDLHLHSYLGGGWGCLLTIACSKFFGAKGSRPEPQQSKLSFATKAAPKKAIERKADAPDAAVKKESVSRQRQMNCYKRPC